VTPALDGAGANRRSRSVKQTILLMVAGLLGTGCCSTNTDLQRLSTSDLQLRRYELMYCLSMAHTDGGKEGPWQNNAYGDVRADLAEKEAIEREITRRNVTDYYWPPSMTYEYINDRCHCKCWVAHL
jgi:hypothetical protein